LYHYESGSAWAFLGLVIAVSDGVVKAIWTIDYNSPNTVGHEYPAVSIGDSVNKLIEWVSAVRAEQEEYEGENDGSARATFGVGIHAITADEAIMLASRGRRWSKTVLPITGWTRQN